MISYVPMLEKIRKKTKKLIKNDLFLAAIITISLVLIGVIIGYESNRVIPITKLTVNTYTLEPKNPLKFLSNWDGPIYLNIAKNGYDKGYLVNFFPLYPAAVALVHKIVKSLLDSGLVVAWGFLFGTFYYYIKIIKEYYKPKKREEIIKAVLVFALYPTAIFFLATFSESLFAFLSLGAIYYALKDHYKLSAIFAALVTMTRINGIFVLALVLSILWFKNKQKLSKIIKTGLLGSVGIVFYMIAMYIRFKNPLEFIKTQQNHGWLHHNIFTQLAHISILNSLFLIPVVVAVFYWWKKEISFSIYSILYLLIPLVGGQFGGFARYTLMIFPVPLMIYEYTKNRQLYYAIVIALFSMGWVYLLIQYSAGYIGS